MPGGTKPETPRKETITPAATLLTCHEISQDSTMVYYGRYYGSGKYVIQDGIQRHDGRRCAPSAMTNGSNDTFITWQLPASSAWRCSPEPGYDMRTTHGSEQATQRRAGMTGDSRAFSNIVLTANNTIVSFKLIPAPHLHTRQQRDRVRAPHQAQSTRYDMSTANTHNNTNARLKGNTTVTLRSCQRCSAPVSTSILHH